MKRLVIIAVLALSSVASAQAPSETTASSPPEKTFGIGYKAGNGIGFLGGDVIINPLPHLSLDLYGTYVVMTASNGDKGTGFALAPAIQGHLFDGQRSTPYAAVGLQYAKMSLDGATASGVGTFANLGYEWKWDSGLGVQLGGGVQYLSKVEATNGTTSVMLGGKLNPNLEIGIRYMFM